MFRLSNSSGVPTYLQIVEQVKHGLLLGYLRIGDQLPTVKEVVADLGINPNTVAKAYRMLEYDGLVEARPGLGTFIVSAPAAIAPAAYTSLRRSLERWFRDAKAADLGDDAIDALITTVRRELRKEGAA
jgi:GntR family transcriptional regulator